MFGGAFCLLLKLKTTMESCFAENNEHCALENFGVKSYYQIIVHNNDNDPDVFISENNNDTTRKINPSIELRE